METINFRQHLERQKGRKQQLQESLAETKEKVNTLFKTSLHCEEAQNIIIYVAQETQQQLSYQLAALVNSAMAAIFDEPYELELDFVIRRNRTECDIWFSRFGERVDPMSATGGGAVDVAAFALRLAIWCLLTPRSRNTLILDEPLKFLSRGYLSKAAQMLQVLSEKLGMQIIMVTHLDEFASVGNGIEIEIKNKISCVK